MNEDSEPNWLAGLVKGGEAMRRQLESIVQAAEQFAAGGPTRLFAQRIARAVDAGMRELLSAPECPVVHQATATLTGVGTMTAAATVTASGGLAMPRMGFAGQGTVQNPPSGPAERSVGQILALVLVAIFTSGLLGVQGPDRAAVDHYLTVIGFALSIALLIWNMDK